MHLVTNQVARGIRVTISHGFGGAKFMRVVCMCMCVVVVENDAAGPHHFGQMIHQFFLFV